MGILLNHKRITTVLSLCLVFLIALEFATHYVEITVLESNQGFSKIINVAGRQRMLSQRAALFSYKYANEPTKRRQEELETLKNTYTKETTFLKCIVQNTKYVRDWNQKEFVTSASRCAEKVTDDLIRKINALLDATNRSQRQTIVKDILHQNDFTLQALDARVSAFEKVSNMSHKYYYVIEDYLFLCRVLFIIMIFALIVLPLSRRMKSHVKELKNVNAQLFDEKKRAEEYTQIKTDFFARMSHELRTPINAIIGYSEILEEDIDNQQQSRDVERILVSARHLLNMINEILEISRIEAQESPVVIKEFDLYNLCNDVLDIINPSAMKNSNVIRYVYAVRNSIISTDPEKLKQSLINLLSNACKFTNNGYILFEITDDPDKSGILKIIVSDTGVGMTAKQQKRIFEPFMQATNEISHSHGGTGLGLSITKSFVTALGGTLHLESCPDQGTKFTMHIPGNLNYSQTSSASLTIPENDADTTTPEA